MGARKSMRIQNKTCLIEHSSGRSVQDTCVTITAADGFTVVLGSVGASIRRIYAVLSDGTSRELALGFQYPSAYLGNALYAGAVLAPTGGRICDGLLHLGDRLVQLEKNEGDVNLHGGSVSGSFLNWDVERAEVVDTMAIVTFALTLPDGLCGFPGNRRFTAVYTLTEDHTLSLTLSAVSDRDTVFNLSSHLYLDLNGRFDGSVMDMPLQIDADVYFPMSEGFVPQSPCPVAGTHYDFRAEKKPRDLLLAHRQDEQAIRNRGYNNAFLLSAPVDTEGMRHVLTAFAADRMIRLDMASDAPSMVMYSGGWIPDDLTLLSGQNSQPSCAMAFECQKSLDAPERPLAYTLANQMDVRTIRWEFTLQ